LPNPTSWRCEQCIKNWAVVNPEVKLNLGVPELETKVVGKRMPGRYSSKLNYIFGSHTVTKLLSLTSPTMRTVISYDDITPPYQAEVSSRSSTRPPPNKKRKWSKAKQPSQRRASRHFSPSTTLEADDNNSEVEGQELTHEDIWDDSALITAWNAATEEYEAYNGPEKGWKTEPVYKSPL
jgi:hypothetical protein